MSPRLAASVALRIASGTSRALPWPKPTRPFSSPTTTSAAKPKRRPPLTALATRLMWTSLSVNSLSSRSRPLSRSRSRCRGSRAMSMFRCADVPLCRCSVVSMFRCAVLEFQAALARGICQRLDAPVEEVAAAVKHDFLDALRRRTLRQQLAHRLGGIDVGAGLFAFTHGLLERGGRRQRLAFDVVDHLRVDVLGRAEHRKARATTGGAPDVPSHFCGPPQRPINDCCHRQLPLLLLAFLAEDEFARILHALALVRLRLAKRPDLGRGLADLLRIDSRDDDLGRLRHHDRDALRNRIDDVVRIAELQLQILALQSGAIADTTDLKLALVALGDA